jgi:hypothetical protein
MSIQELWNKYKKFIIVLIVVMFLLVILNVVRNRSFIEITIEGTSNNKVTYELLDQRSNKKISLTGSNNIKKLVSRSRYEVIVSSDSKNAWQLVETSGFFRTTKVTITPKNEIARTFIANDPSGCMVPATVLLSYECSGPLSGVKRHLRGDITTPPQVSEGIENSGNNPESITQTKEGLIALIGESETGEFDEAEISSPEPKYFMSLLDTDGSRVIEKKEISLSINDIRHTIKPYKDGFVIFSDDFSEVKYFTNFNDTGEAINIGDIEEGFSVQQIEVNPENIVITVSNYSENENNTTNRLQKGLKSYTYIYEGKNLLKKLEFNTYWNKALVCAKDRLCLLSIENEKNQIDVYDIGQKKPKKLYSINNARDMFLVKDQLKVVTPSNILSINIPSRKGAVDYSFNENKYCGEVTIYNSTEYIVCISNIGARSYAIQLNPKKDTAFYVDRTINNLEKESYINSVSVDLNNLYVIPEYGNPTFSESLGEFAIDESIINDVNRKIIQNPEIINLKANGYTIINGEGGLF